MNSDTSFVRSLSLVQLDPENWTYNGVLDTCESNDGAWTYCGKMSTLRPLLDTEREFRITNLQMMKAQNDLRLAELESQLRRRLLPDSLRAVLAATNPKQKEDLRMARLVERSRLKRATFLGGVVNKVYYAGVIWGAAMLAILACVLTAYALKLVVYAVLS